MMSSRRLALQHRSITKGIHQIWTPLSQLCLRLVFVIGLFGLLKKAQLPLFVLSTTPSAKRLQENITTGVFLRGEGVLLLRSVDNYVYVLLDILILSETGLYIPLRDKIAPVVVRLVFIKHLRV